MTPRHNMFLYIFFITCNHTSVTNVAHITDEVRRLNKNGRLKLNVNKIKVVLMG